MTNKNHTKEQITSHINCSEVVSMENLSCKKNIQFLRNISNLTNSL